MAITPCDHFTVALSALPHPHAIQLTGDCLNSHFSVPLSSFSTSVLLMGNLLHVAWHVVVERGGPS